LLRKSYITTFDILKQYPDIQYKEKEEILCAVLHIPKIQLIREIKEIYVNKKEEKEYFENIKKLLGGKPIQQIIKSVEFNGVTIKIDENVLIPRPETEYFADLLSNAIKSILTKGEYKNKPYKILEVGTGSGAICVSLAKRLEKYSNLQITGIDISEKAVKILRQNIEANHILPKLSIKCSGIGTFGSTETYNLIISNPPYIPTKKIKYLNKSVKNFEPVLALDGGDDGLCIVREIINFGIENSKGNDDLVIALEINSKKQFNTIKKEFKGTFNAFKLLKDQYGRYRFIILSKTILSHSIYPLL